MKTQNKYNKSLLHTLIISLAVLMVLQSCTKKLDVKPNQGLLVPSSAAEYQTVIDNDLFNIAYPVLGELASGDYYLEDTRYASLSVDDQRIYVWAKELYGVGRSVGDWDRSFNKLRSVNAVLFGLDELKNGVGSAEYNNVKGSALFFRAYAHFNLAQIFCKPYRAATAASDPGIPLLLNLDVINPPKRVSIAKSYEQIFSDLNAAMELLPQTSPYKTRPSKLAVNALLCRVYMSLADYSKALQYGDAALKIYNTLIDYKTLPASGAYPLKRLNAETILYSEINSSNSSGAGGAIFYNSSSCAIVKDLYDSYSADDLRKTLFFTKQPTGLNTWQGSYSGTYILFGGLATDELYLNRAECYARKGDVDLAMKDLNVLLSNRISGNFVPRSAASPVEAVKLILSERRKELLFRGLRWIDLRRLGSESDYATTLQRVVNGITYTLPPNDPRYVYPIPADEITISGMEQNVR